MTRRICISQKHFLISGMAVFMRMIWLASFVFFLFLKSVAQQKLLIPYRKATLWGYADTTGRIVIQPKYDEASLFFNGFAPVKKSGKRGLINAKGKELIPTSYTEFIDCCYRYLIAMDSFKVSLIRLKDGLVLLPLSDRKIRPAYGRFFITTTNTGKGLFDAHKRKWILPEKHEEIEFYFSREENHFFYARTSTDTTYFMLTSDENFRSLKSPPARENPPTAFTVEDDPPPEQDVLSGPDAVITTWMSAFTERGGKKGFVRTTRGDFTSSDSLPAIYDSIEINPFNNDQFIVRKNGRAGIVGLDGSTVMSLDYDDIQIADSSSVHGIYIVKRNGKWGLADREKIILPFEYDRIYGNSTDLRGFVLSKNNKTGMYFYDRSRKIFNVLIPAEYDIIFGLNFVQLADVDQSVRYDLQNQEGKRIIMVKKNGYMGYIDLAGREYFE